jgi:hypothetical protein
VRNRGSDLRIVGWIFRLCAIKSFERMVARDGVEPPTPAFSELVFPVFPTTSMVAVGLPNTGKYEESARIVGDCRG